MLEGELFELCEISFQKPSSLLAETLPSLQYEILGEIPISWGSLYHQTDRQVERHKCLFGISLFLSGCFQERGDSPCLSKLTVSSWTWE